MKLTNLDKISLEEINKDFLFYEQKLEEDICQNELLNILNNSSEKNFSESNIRNVSKVKRCKNVYEEEKYFEFVKENDIESLFQDLNELNEEFL